MGKIDLVKAVAEATGLTQIEVEAVIDAFLQQIMDTLATGEKVTIKDFGTFRIRKRRERTVQLPNSEKKARITGGPIPVFKSSPYFRDYVAQHSMGSAS